MCESMFQNRCVKRCGQLRAQMIGSSWCCRVRLVPKWSWVGLVCGLLLVGTILSGCADKDRRLSEAETLQYKQRLVQEGELAPGQATRMGQFLGRTEEEIDAYYNELLAEQNASESQ